MPPQKARGPTTVAVSRAPISCPGETRDDSAPDSTAQAVTTIARASPLRLVIEPTASGRKWTARLRDRVLCVTVWPFVKSARLLLAEGHPADTVIEMWRPNTDEWAIARSPRRRRRDGHRRRDGLARRQERATGSRSRAGWPEGGRWSALVVGRFFARGGFRGRRGDQRGGGGGARRKIPGAAVMTTRGVCKTVSARRKENYERDCQQQEQSTPHAEITLFEKSDGPLTKRISLAADGSVKSDGSACVMARGTARRVRIANVKQLATLIEQLPQNQAIALGALRTGLARTK